MCDQDTHSGAIDPAFSRRDLPLTASVAGGAAAGGGGAAVVDRDVTIATPDGEADAILAHPAGSGPWPAVLVWVDIFGLRQVFREMARRLAAEGYVVLVPNPYYRTIKGAPGGGKPMNMGDEADKAVLYGLLQSLTPETTEVDAPAFVQWLDALPEVDKSKGIGTQGYCMGGLLALRSAAAVPERITAVASFHGSRLTTDQPNSPHLLIPKLKGEHLFLIADNDDKAQPESKDILRQSFADAGLPAKIEVYEGAMHGWCVPGHGVYSEAPAEKAWGELLTLYRRVLV